MKTMKTSVIAGILLHLRLVITLCIRHHVSAVEERHSSERLTSYCRTAKVPAVVVRCFHYLTWQSRSFQAGSVRANEKLVPLLFNPMTFPRAFSRSRVT